MMTTLGGGETTGDIGRLISLPRVERVDSHLREKCVGPDIKPGDNAKALLGEALVEIANCESKRAGWQGFYGDAQRGLAGVE
ncbi:hypothetical protein FHS85_004977 [Rhodoligotrophos appendicifer]|uniref:hypothetical protein n=1 Tax=Rhodoligotrophos appendicifer TaxID=987056 RepID=UPI0011848D6B|nr:hypothetical protein [Rhodoligotrophos appendicifer]